MGSWKMNSASDLASGELMVMDNRGILFGPNDAIDDVLREGRATSSWGWHHLRPDTMEGPHMTFMEFCECETNHSDDDRYYGC